MFGWKLYKLKSADKPKSSLKKLKMVRKVQDDRISTSTSTYLNIFQS